MKKTRITEGAGKSSTPLPKKTTPKAGASKTLQQSAAKKAKGRSDKFKAVNKKAGIKGLKENRFNPRLRKENSVIDNNDIRDRGDDVLDKPTRTEPSTVKVQVTFRERRQLLQTTASVLHEIGFDAGDLEHSRSFDLYGPGVWIYEFLSTATYDDVLEKYPELAKFEDSTLNDKEIASAENIDTEDLSEDGLRDFLNSHLEDALYASADGVNTQFRGTGLTIEGSKEQVKKALAFVYNTEPEDISDEDISDILVESASPRRAGRRLNEDEEKEYSLSEIGSALRGFLREFDFGSADSDDGYLSILKNAARKIGSDTDTVDRLADKSDDYLHYNQRRNSDVKDFVSALIRVYGRGLSESKKGAGKSSTPLPKKTTPKAGASKILQVSAAKKAKGKSDKFKKVNKKAGIKGLKESADPRMSAYSHFLDFSSPLRYLSEGYSLANDSEYPQGVDGDIKAALDENIGEIETAAHGLIQEIIASDWLNNALANLDVDAFDDTDKIEGLIRAKVIEVLGGGVNESLEGLEDEELIDEANEAIYYIQAQFDGGTFWEENPRIKRRFDNSEFLKTAEDRDELSLCWYGSKEEVPGIKAKVERELSGLGATVISGLLSGDENLDEDNEFDTRSAIYNNAKEQGRVWEYLDRYHEDFLAELFPDGNPSGQNVESILNNFDVSVPGVSREDLITFLEVVVEEGI